MSYLKKNIGKRLLKIRESLLQKIILQKMRVKTLKFIKFICAFFIFGELNYSL